MKTMNVVAIIGLMTALMAGASVSCRLSPFWFSPK